MADTACRLSPGMLQPPRANTAAAARCDTGWSSQRVLFCERAVFHGGEAIDGTEQEHQLPDISEALSAGSGARVDCGVEPGSLPERGTAESGLEAAVGRRGWADSCRSSMSLPPTRIRSLGSRVGCLFSADRPVRLGKGTGRGNGDGAMGRRQMGSVENLGFGLFRWSPFDGSLAILQANRAGI